MPTKTINHHIIITDEEQNMIVNALAFFEQFFQLGSNTPPSDVVEEWQDVADDTNLDAVDVLATKIANSN
tara:strand:+ start:305 stop:514 length:210 start_codon:yes stop_codon:yes gene_type:complete